MQTIAIVFAVLTIVADNIYADSCNSPPPNNEARLRNHLLCKYDKDYLPVPDGKAHKVGVYFNVETFTFDPNAHALNAAGWMIMLWFDENLKWNTSDFNGISRISTMSDTIWQPNLAVHNNDVDNAESELCGPVMCDIEDSGEVTCMPPCRVSTRCPGNFRYWPYSTHNCTITLSSWNFANDEIFLKFMLWFDNNQTVDGQYHLMNNEGNESVRNNTHFFSMLLKSTTSTHAAIVLSPAIVIMLINLLTLWLMPECTERLILICFNIFLHLTYLHMLYWYVPMAGNETPLIVIFYEVSLLLTLLLEINAILARGLKQLQSRPPKWLCTCSSMLLGKAYFDRDYLLATDRTTDDSSRINQWTPIVKGIDRLLFSVVALIYVIMLCVMLWVVVIV